MTISRTDRRYGRFLISILFVFSGFSNSIADDLLLNVNVKKPMAVVSDKFLSITVDPVAFIKSDDLRYNRERSASMAEALAPAYVRIGGPQSNSYVFQSEADQQENHEASNYTLTGTNWTTIHRWAEESGLDVIASIPPRQSNNRLGTSSWDTSNALNLISFSDHMGFNTNWQLGYECQTYCGLSGKELGKDVNKIRQILNDYPRFESSRLIGPDVAVYKSREQQQYLQDYLEAAGPVLSAITWHPNFAGLTLQSEGFSMHHDNLAAEKNNLLKIMNRSSTKKPVWIAESKQEESKRHFLGSLIWARRLGNAAKLGFQVLMRQPDQSKFFDPTPDYWVSVLHKKLIGQEILDTKIVMGNRSHVYVYAHCAKPTENAKKGSLAIFGINLTPSNIAMTLRGLKITTVHNYILLPGFDSENRLFSETVLLNDEPLSLTIDNKIPEIEPFITNAEYIDLPSGAIGFWVLPELNIKACIDIGSQMGEKLSQTSKSLDEFELAGEHDGDGQGSLNEKRDTAKEGNLKSMRRFRAKGRKSGDSNFKRLAHKGDLEKIRKILRRKAVAEDKGANQRNRNVHAVFENIKKQSAGVKSRHKKDSEEEPRARVWNHNARHPVRKKRLGPTKPIYKQKNEDIDKSLKTDKVIEALTLMTKVENAMNDMESTDVDILKIINGDLNSRESYGLADDKDAALLDAVLNTEKAKETKVPVAIEDQLKALYNLLSVEEEENEGQLQTRFRRDLEPFTIRPSPIRKRIKNDDVKERLLERRMRRKEKEELRKDSPFSFVHSRNSDTGDNTFYGFATRDPIEGFPNGDVYLKAGDTTEQTQKSSAPISDERTMNKRSKSVTDANQEQGIVWTAADSSNIFVSPNAYEDNTMMKLDNNEHSKDEHWTSGPAKAPETISENIGMQQKVINDYDSQQGIFHKERMTQNSPTFLGTKDDTISHADEKHTAVEKMDSAGGLSYEVVTFLPQVSHEGQDDLSLAENVGHNRNMRRTKRQTDNLEEVLDREMMLQQYNDMDEVQRRVIRLDENGQEIVDDESTEQSSEELSTEQEEVESTEYPLLREEDELVEVPTNLQLSPSSSEESSSVEGDEESYIPQLLETSDEQEESSRLARQIEIDSRNETETQFFLDGEREVRSSDTDSGAEKGQETADRNGDEPERKESSSLDTKEFEVEEISVMDSVPSDSGTKERRSTSHRNKSPKTRATGDSNSKKKPEKAETTRPPVLSKSAKPRERLNLKDRLDSVKSKIRKPKSSDTQNRENRHTQKSEELTKAREARIAARNEALASLRRENEGKKKEKVAETTTTPAPEKITTTEEPRKRNEQFGKLRQKLRTKRAKIIQQYREELTDAVHESLDSKIGKRNRRASATIEISNKGNETKINVNSNSTKTDTINPKETTVNPKESGEETNKDASEEETPDYSSDGYDDYDYYDDNSRGYLRPRIFNPIPTYWVTSPGGLYSRVARDSTSRYAPYYVIPTHYYNRGLRIRREATPSRVETINGPLFFSLGLNNLRGKQDTEQLEPEMEKSAEERSVEDSNSKEIEEEISEKDFSKTESTDNVYNKLANLLSDEKSNDNAQTNSDVDVTYAKKDQRRKRHAVSLGDISEEIERSSDKEEDNIWSNMEEIERDENILEEYIREKNQIIENFKRTQENLKNYVQIANEQKILDNGVGSKKDSPNANSLDEISDREKKGVADKSGIQSLLADAIPKLQEAVTGGLEKAKNVTNCLEDFIENFDDKFNATMSVENPGNSKNNETCVDEGKLSFNVFQAMVSSVKKFFNLVSEVSRSLQD